jgi:hypothetical protein
MRWLGCVFLVCASIAFAAPSARLFHSSAYLIAAVDPPTGWELAASPPSSRLLATWTHRDGARLTLVAEASAETDAGKLFDRAKTGIERQAWVVKHVDRQPTRVTVEATVDRGRRVGRQLYAVEKGFSYVLTLVAPADQATDRARDFDDTVSSMRIGPDAR